MYDASGTSVSVSIQTVKWWIVSQVIDLFNSQVSVSSII